MASKVCPQRIIDEAIRLLISAELQENQKPDFGSSEKIADNILQLDSLSRALYRDGIYNIIPA